MLQFSLVFVLYYKDAVPIPISIFLCKVSVAQEHVIMMLKLPSACFTPELSQVRICSVSNVFFDTQLY